MTSPMIFHSATIVLAAAASMLTVTAPATAADGSNQPTIRIRVNLADGAGRQLARRQAFAAAREVCHVFDHGDLEQHVAARNCFADTVKSITAQLARAEAGDGARLAALDLPAGTPIAK